MIISEAIVELAVTELRRLMVIGDSGDKAETTRKVAETILRLRLDEEERLRPVVPWLEGADKLVAYLREKDEADRKERMERPPFVVGAALSPDGEKGKGDAEEDPKG